MHLTPKLLKPLTAKKLAITQQQQQPSQLTFVDVDPALAEPTPPKTAKYYSANNSVAANPHPKEALVPEILGRQDKMMKTTPDVRLKPKPLQPSPPGKETAASEAKPMPKKTYVPGDLAMAKPSEKPQDKNGQSDTTDIGTDTPAQPAHQRPRTIAEAMAQHGMLGEKTRQDGGVKRFKMDSSLDAIKTPYGDYDAEFIDAVRQRWYQLLEDHSVDQAGRVVVEFHLHPDGRVTDLSILQSNMSDLLGLICQEAIQDPSPYRPWPLEMRLDIPKPYRDVTFTFYYGLE
jgi:TonB family protein